MKSLLLSIALATAVLSTAQLHADTTLAEPWIDNAYVNNHGPVKNILVIGVPDHPDERHQLEQTFSKALSDSGVSAMPSLDIMSADVEVNKGNVLAAIAGRDFDAVLLTQVYRVDDVDIVPGGDPDRVTDRDFAIQLWDNYEGARDQALDARKKKEHRLVLENNLYDLKSEDLVWSVQSYSINPKSSDKIIRELSRLIPASLKKASLI